MRHDIGEGSMWTVLIYLTGGVVGGETRIFLHPQPHEGAPVVSGEQVVLRTDVMYRLTR